MRQLHLSESWSVTATDLITIADASHSLPICPTTLRKLLRAGGVPLVLYRRRWFVSWRELAAWAAANTDLIARRAEWGRSIHRGRRAARAGESTTSTAGGGL